MTDTDKLMQRMREILDSIHKDAGLYYLPGNGKSRDDRVMAAAIAAMLAARNEGLEEAAVMAESFKIIKGDKQTMDSKIAAYTVAKAIRAMKSGEDK